MYFYYRLFRRHIPGEGKSIHIAIPVPIRSSKKTEINNFHTPVPKIKYIQDDENNYCFSSLALAMFDTREYVFRTGWCIATKGIFIILIKGV